MDLTTHSVHKRRHDETESQPFSKHHASKEILEDVPIDIIKLIFRSFDEKTFCSFSCTNKNWNKKTYDIQGYYYLLDREMIQKNTSHDNITTINSGQKSTDKLLKAISNLGCATTSITSLNLSGSLQITDQGLRAINAFTQLKILNLTGSFRETPSRNSPKKFDPKYAPFEENARNAAKGISYDNKISNKCLQGLDKLNTLTEINLSNNDITTVTITHLNRFSFLNTLHLSHCVNLEQKSYENLKKCTALTSLDLSKNVVGTGCKIPLQFVASLEKMKQLNLSETLITNEDLDHIPSTLTSLIVANCPLIGEKKFGQKEEGYKKIAAFTKLKKFDFSNNSNNRFRTTAELSSALERLTQLEDLNLSRTQIITEENCANLPKSLTSVTLSNCHTSRDLLASLCAYTLPKITSLTTSLPNLTSLDLLGNHFTDETVSFLQTIPELKFHVFDSQINGYTQSLPSSADESIAMPSKEPATLNTLEPFTKTEEEEPELLSFLLLGGNLPK